MTYAGPHKYTIFFSWVFSALSAVVSFAPYICIYLICRELLASWPDLAAVPHDTVMDYGWTAVKATALSFGLYGGGLMLSHIAAFNLIGSVRTRMIRRLEKLPLGFHLEHPSGGLRKVLEKNAENLENFVAHQLPDLIQVLVLPVAFVSVMFAFDWRLSLVCLLPILIGFLLLRSMLWGQSQQFLFRYQEALGDMNSAAVEYVRGISVVKVFGQTARSFGRFRDAVFAYKEFITEFALSMETSMTRYIAAVHGVFFVLVPAGILLFMWVQDKERFILSFIFFIVLTPLSVVVLLRIMHSSSNAMIVGQALDSIEDILNQEDMPSPAVPKRPGRFDIVLDNVTFRYAHNAPPALDGVSFRVEEGSVTALVGPSGGGKTTMVNLIARFWDVQDGAIRVGGVDLRDMDYETWMRQATFVFQDINLFRMSVADNVAFFRPDAGRHEVLRALEQAQCNDILEKLPQGVDTVLGTSGAHLSGGEMQRISLARAMLKDSPVILLDEATAYADAENEYRIHAALDELTRDKTVIMVAHRLSSVVGADRILMVDAGRILESGTHDSLVEQGGAYARMYAEYQTGAAWKIRNDFQETSPRNAPC